MERTIIALPKEVIDEIFEAESGAEKPHQQNVAVALYKIALPNWSDIESIDGWPTVSKPTNEYIFGKFIEFDVRFHKGVMHGGLWMNNGFSTVESEGLEDWCIDTSTCKVTLKSEVKDADISTVSEHL